jgi:hypothetical protein
MGPSVVAGEQPSAVMPHGMSALGCLPAQCGAALCGACAGRRRGFGGGGSADRRPLRIGGALARRLVRSAGQLQHGFRFLKFHPKT